MRYPAFFFIAAIATSFAARPPPKTISKEYEARVAEHYALERIATPPGVEPQIGGLTVLSDGRVVACFHHGQVATFDPRNGLWKVIAEGLHEPLGIVPAADGSLIVMQRPELTRLRDLDGDGVMDRYETLWDGFGMSGNYHEFAFGPVRGANGKLYVALNIASNGAPPREEIRGPWSEIGMPRRKFYEGDWKGHGNLDAGRMYSRVAYRGWVMEIDEATGAATPYACGFRSPDGLGIDATGQLFVNDNQGDWRGTSEVHAVKRDGFYGHPASLVWRQGWDGTEPRTLPIERLDALRTVPAIELPYGTYANSPTQMIVIPRTPAWGPFGGQLLTGDMNSPRLLRLLPEQVEGVWQGACVFLVEAPAVKNGLHRFAFTGDTLYIGRTHLSWAGNEGLTALRPLKTPFDPLELRVTPRGFRFVFTSPLAANAAEPARWTGQRYYYKYHEPYGSPEMDKAEFSAANVRLNSDRRTVEVELSELKTGYIYDFDLAEIRSADGELPLNSRIAYTLNKLPKQ